MKTNKALLIALPLALAACGGGGGGGGDNPTVDNTKPQQLGKTADYVGALFTTPANKVRDPEVRGTVNPILCPLQPQAPPSNVTF